MGRVLSQQALTALLKFIAAHSSQLSGLDDWQLYYLRTLGVYYPLFFSMLGNKYPTSMQNKESHGKFTEAHNK
jgi:hypothetical protein